MIPHLTIDIAPLLGLLAVMLTTIGIVYVAATLYYKRKQQLFWDRAEAMANEPQTDAERAAYEQFDKPIISTEDAGPDFLDTMFDLYSSADEMPEGDPAVAAPSAADQKLDQEVQDKARAERAAREEIPLGVVFDGGDGFKYKYVRNPVSGARVKMKVTGAVRNPDAVPMPQGEEMSRISRHQAIDTLEIGNDATALNVDDEGVACELCSQKEQHSHASAELKRFIRERAEASFRQHIENMDLTQLPMADVEKLWARCRARIEENAVLKEMTRLEGIWDRVANFDEEDELFFQETVAQAAQGPIPLRDVERSPAPDYSKAYDEVDDDEEEGEAPVQLPYVGGAVKNPEAAPMPKRYMSSILRQDAEDSAYLGLKSFGEDLAEEVIEDDKKSVAMEAAGAVVQHFLDKEDPELEQDARSARLDEEIIEGVNSKFFLDQLTENRTLLKRVVLLANDYADLSPDELLEHSQAVWLATKALGKDSYKLTQADLDKIGLKVELKDARVDSATKLTPVQAIKNLTDALENAGLDEKPKKKGAKLKSKTKARKKTKK